MFVEVELVLRGLLAWRNADPVQDLAKIEKIIMGIAPNILLSTSKPQYGDYRVQ